MPDIPAQEQPEQPIKPDVDLAPTDGVRPPDSWLGRFLTEWGKILRGLPGR